MKSKIAKRSLGIILFACILIMGAEIEAREIPQYSHVAGVPSRSTYFNQHYIYRFTSRTTVQIENGAEWEVASHDSYIVDSWREGDAISISVCHEPYYAYCINNTTCNTSVRANLFQGPYMSSPYTFQVVAIDNYQNQVFLQNAQGSKMLLKIASSDIPLFRKWAINDVVILGDNFSWVSWFNSNPYILINVSLNNSPIRARQL